MSLNLSTRKAHVCNRIFMKYYIINHSNIKSCDGITSRITETLQKVKTQTPSASLEVLPFGIPHVALQSFNI